MKKMLADLDFILRSPIKIEERVNREAAQEIEITNDGNALVKQILVTMRIVCSNLLLSPTTEPKNGKNIFKELDLEYLTFYFILVLIFIGLLNICLASDLYQPQQKQLLLSWKQKIGSIWQTLPATLQTPHGSQTSWHNPSSFSRRSSLQNWHKFSLDHVGHPECHPSLRRENLTCMPFQGNSMFQQRRSDPNIKFSSSYPSGINIKKW